MAQTQLHGSQIKNGTLTSSHLEASFSIPSSKVTGLPSIAGLVKADGTVPLTADLPAGGHKITGLGAPLFDTDASTKKYVDDTVEQVVGSGDFMADGSVPMTGNLAMGAHKITGMAAPTSGTDAATKQYVDDAVSGSGLVASNFVVRETPTGDVDGTNIDFTLANTPLTGKECVYLNGQLLEPGDDYTLTNAALAFVIPPMIGSKIRVNYMK